MSLFPFPSPAQEVLPAIELQTGDAPLFSVIWLHGLGADGSDFAPVVPELGLAGQPGIRFVFPHAPEIPVSCNGGYIMPAWYDIISLEPHSREIDVAGILHSRDALRALIARENARGVPCEHIFLAGFSQGGAVAYVTALTHPQRLAGLIALSTYLPTPQVVRDEATEVNRNLAIFAAHGTVDDVVSPQLGKAARDFLVELGHRPAWHEYPMPHSVCLEEIADIGAWLRERMAAK